MLTFYGDVLLILSICNTTKGTLFILCKRFCPPGSQDLSCLFVFLKQIVILQDKHLAEYYLVFEQSAITPMQICT